jgi:hypothetical protein
VFEPWQPQSAPERADVLAQLETLLAHPLFSQSKRYPALLRYVVEQTLLGNTDQVKERSIGIDVFGRPPGYDANADPIVRVTAGEIRKRLAQFYYDPAHSHEIRIELPTGSYVPVFQRFSAPSPGNDPVKELAREPENEPVSEPEKPSTLLHESPASPSQAFPAALAAPPIPHHRNHPYLTLLLTVLALLTGLAAGYEYRRSMGPLVAAVQPPSPADQALDDFWQPLTSGPAIVTFCLGEPARDSAPDSMPIAGPSGQLIDPTKPIPHSKLSQPLYFRLHESGLFALADVTSLTRLSAPLQKQHKPFRVSAASEASFAQLREGPAVLIGAFDNLWTMRLTRGLRFGFDTIDGDASIIDRKSSTKTTWATAWDTPYEKLARDYAIVARYRDPLTGQPVVVAAGISEEGTEAAGELISNPADLAVLLRNAPANWRTMNMEAVIETQVIGGHATPPQLRAVEFW